MEIFESRTGTAVVVHVVGGVNSSSAAELEERLKRSIDADHSAIVLDLERLDYMTSAGLRCLLRIEKKTWETAGKLVLCGLHGLTLELFDVGGFLEMFVIARSREDAVLQASAM